jgi:hypothetical protein
MPEFKIYFKVTGSGHTYIEAETLEDAYDVLDDETVDLNFDLDDDLNWELDREFTKSENK